MKAMLAISMCSMPHIQKPNTETVQIIEQQWSTRLNRGSAQRDGSGTPSTVEWQPLYPTLRVPGSNPQSLPELKAYHGLGRVELPGLALACAPSTSTQSAPATSVIVAPGGAYKFVGVPGKPEADSVLEWLCATGDAAVFVLKYRVPSVGPPATPSNFGGLPWGEPALMDAQRAVRLVRWWAGHNQSLKLDPLRVGFLGLSAGAHLVAHLAWRHDERLYARLDAVDEENALPDFQILVYPWNLELAPSSRWLSGILRQPSNASRPLPTFRLRARRDTPPTLLAQELTDGASPGAASAIGYFASLQAEAAGATNRTDELHLYNSTGAHGAGACRQQTSATSTARCGTRHSGTTLGSPPTSLRELHRNPCSHRMCEDWPKKALRFMRRLDFAAMYRCRRAVTFGR